MVEEQGLSHHMDLAVERYDDQIMLTLTRGSERQLLAQHFLPAFKAHLDVDECRPQVLLLEA